ncbi:MAG TPA: hypothetical protein VJ508_20570 [Saprospiraceae bacterium]|nr:hypothetical protein [Saprospiraceae bacterium]
MGELAEKYHVNLNWKKRLFETGGKFFDGTLSNVDSGKDKDLKAAAKELQAKDQIIAQLAEENLALRKTFVGDR